MPIIGLTDKTPSFKEIGRLRLGIAKTDPAFRGPKEISYFRSDFRPEEVEAATLFAQAYGSEPAAINVRLPFAEISRMWDAHYTVHNTAGMLGKADGERWIYLRDNKTGALLVKDGVPQDHTPDCKVDASGMLYKPFDKNIPVYSYRSSKGQDVAVYAKPEGRLSIVVPELKRAAYMLLITHSIYNVMNLSAELAGIAEVAKNAGLTLPFVPLVLTRRLEKISVTIGGKKSMQEKYLVHLEINPAWMGAQMDYLDGITPGTALPAPRSAPVFELPAEVRPDELLEDGYIDGEPDEAEYFDGEPDAEPEDAASMALETALAVTNSQGRTLGSMNNATLNDLLKNINKALDDGGTSDDLKTSLEYKRDAVLTVLKSRN